MATLLPIPADTRGGHTQPGKFSSLSSKWGRDAEPLNEGELSSWMSHCVPRPCDFASAHTFHPHNNSNHYVNLAPISLHSLPQLFHFTLSTINNNLLAHTNFPFLPRSCFFFNYYFLLPHIHTQITKLFSWWKRNRNLLMTLMIIVPY